MAPKPPPLDPTAPRSYATSRKLLWGLLLEQKKWLAVSLALALVFAWSQYEMSRLVKFFTDEALLQSSARRSFELAAIFFALVFLEAIAGFGNRYFSRIAAERLIFTLRNRVFARLLTFSESTLARFSSGEAVTRVVNDVFLIGIGLVQGADILRAPLVLFFHALLLFQLNWKLTLVCLVVFPLLGFASDRLGRSARRNQRRLQQSIEQVSNHIMETMKGLKLAHVFEQTPLLRHEFGGKAGSAYGYLIKLARLEESVNPLTKILTGLVGSCVIGYAGWQVSQGQMSPGAFIAFIVAAARLVEPFRVLNDFNLRFQQMSAAADRVQELLEEPLDPIGTSQRERLHAKLGPTRARTSTDRQRLAFDDVSFRYPVRRGEARGEGASESPLALREINLVLEPGHKMALVGRSGSGKSTLSLLALRLIDPVAGAVTLGGRDARTWDIADYRSHFSYVSQDVFLFNRSIRENLQFARPGARDTEIWAALEKAHIAELVKATPRQLDTMVAFEGADFSGGEKQRLSLARAFLRNSPVLILDEATSQLDAFSEKAVQSALHELMADRTVIVIAHRLSTVREMDEVCVFDGGRVVERGAPGTLLEGRSGPFYELWATQNPGRL